MNTVFPRISARATYFKFGFKGGAYSRRGEGGGGGFNKSCF